MRLDWCSYKAAKYAVEHWHYSKTMPQGKNVMIGVYEDNKYIGCIIFGRGVSKSLLTSYNLEINEGCELVRIALKAHKSTVSKMISIAVKMLKKKDIGLRLIVSFADTNQKHLGKIYQASNWIYSGKTDRSYVYLDEYGKEWHTRAISRGGHNIQFGRIKKTPKISDCIKIRREGKHRYLYALDKEMKRQILPLSKPYPKKI